MLMMAPQRSRSSDILLVTKHLVELRVGVGDQVFGRGLRVEVGSLMMSGLLLPLSSRTTQTAISPYLLLCVLGRCDRCDLLVGSFSRDALSLRRCGPGARPGVLVAGLAAWPGRKLLTVLFICPRPRLRPTPCQKHTQLAPTNVSHPKPFMGRTLHRVEGRTRRLLRHRQKPTRTPPSSADTIELGRRTARGCCNAATTGSDAPQREA